MGFGQLFDYHAKYFIIFILNYYCLIKFEVWFMDLCEIK